ncbi:MAG: NADH-dependent [FeFe] hydrogenase, group A6 [Cetobacterium sp.]|uniref:NADH-dependent [FeFe] hydrogenase, group A6 n=1 Tax=Cetobacterium sp. TaxID=2071632 RepID=UPI002FC722B8
MEMINLTINGVSLKAESGSTILNAAKIIGIKIPKLCNMEMKDIGFIHRQSCCRICLVEVDGVEDLLPACSTHIWEGMSISTNNIKVMTTRRTILELLLSDHPKSCLYCPKNHNCELQELAADLGIREVRIFGASIPHALKYTKAIVRDPNKCIKCRRCEAMCRDIQTCNVLSQAESGFRAVVETAFKENLEDPENKACTFCGQCVAVCPVAAIYETTYIWKLIEDLANPKKKVIVQVAPSVRVSLGEEFGLPPGTNVTGKMVSALRKLGFDEVFDTNFAADNTIMEEAAEVKERIEKYLSGDKDVRLPILTSCCPAWINFIEHNYPDMLDIPSTTKSPMEIFGSVAKNIWTKSQGIERENLVCVSIMPCLAKKYEAGRPEFHYRGNPDVDYSLSTRELASLLKQADINLCNMEESEFDNPLGVCTGAGAIFGRTGGVMEAALRTAYEWITEKELLDVNFYALRGIEEVRVAEVMIGSIPLKIGIAHGLGAARKLLDKIKNGEENFHAIEIMACKGGCVGGGGQPFHHGNFEIIEKRIAAIQEIDDKKIIRKSHDNPYIKLLYKKYFTSPLSPEAIRLLHTTYYPKNNSSSD